jgi:hypothetical protein
VSSNEPPEGEVGTGRAIHREVTSQVNRSDGMRSRDELSDGSDTDKQSDSRIDHERRSTRFSLL